MLTETWLRNHLDAEINIPSYSIYRADRIRPKKHRGRNSGGSAIYLKDEFCGPTEVQLNFSSGVNEAVGLKILKHNLLLFCLYRQPDDPAGGNRSTSKEFSELLESISSVIEDAAAPVPNLLIAGDFNLPKISWPGCTPKTGASADEKRMTEILSDFCARHFLIQTVSQATHKAGNILDLILTNNEEAFSFIDATPCSPISSHYMVRTTCCLTSPVPQAHKIDTSSSRFDGMNLFSEETDWANMNNTLSSMDWSSIFCGLTVAEMVQQFITRCEDVANKCSPKKINLGSRKRPRIPRERRVLMRKRTRLQKQHRSSNGNMLKISSISKKLANIEHQLQKSYQDQDKFEETRAVDAIKTNPKYFYSYAKHRSKVRYPVGPLEDHTGTLIDNPAEMAKILAEQYKSAFSTPSLSAPDVSTPPTMTMQDIEFGPDDIADAIDSLSTNSSPGPDRFPAIMLKRCRNNLSVPIFMIWRKSLDTGEIPLSLKNSSITPIYKGGSRHLAKNYRPIALTSHLIKIFEKVIRKQITDFLERLNLMNPNQHGFRAGHSCLSQLLQHFDYITKLLEEGENIDVIYLDFAKAFDKVDFAITLKKLLKMGVIGKVYRWIRSFITGRNQVVYVDGQKSEAVPVQSGVPQGSVVGPLLFIIMLHDIDNTVSSAHVSSFADDTRVSAGVTSHREIAQLQADLDLIFQWASQNNAMFNPDKFECLRYGSNETLKESSSYLSSDGSTITSKPSVKDLGVTMGASASFEEHIAHITSAANLKCAWILRTFKTRESLPLITLWKSLVLPTLDYCSQLWCPSTPGTIQCIEKVQMSFLKKIHSMSQLDYWQQLKSLRMMSLERRRERYRAIYVWKIMEGLAPNFGINTAYNKRKGRYAVVPHIKSTAKCRYKTIRFNSMGVGGPRIFNSLPVHLRNMASCSVESFKKALDKHLETIPDEPRVPGLIKFCKQISNSLTDQ